MAGIVGTGLNFTFGSNGSPSTPVDNSSKVASIDFNFDQDVPDVTPFGVTSRAYAVGLSSGAISVEFFWDATIAAQLIALIGYTTAVDFVLGPNGSTSTYIKYTGSMFLKSMGQPMQVGDVKKVKCEFQATGTITRTTF